MDSLTLPMYSPKLNLIELVFSIVVQRFVSQFGESIVSKNEEAFSMLHNIIDSISLNAIFSCYNKYSYSNF